MNDTFDAILGIGLLIGSFFAGRRTGYNNATHEYNKRELERDILLLRQEIQELRKSKEIN